MRDFPGGPLAETPSSLFRGPGFDPWETRNQIPHGAAKSPYAAIKTQCSQIKKYIF